MSKRTRREFLKDTSWVSLGLFAGMAGISACKKPDQEPPPNQTTRKLSPLAMQAAWVNDAEFTGYFVAIEKGLYKQEGLDLKYIPGGPDVIPESSLISGRSTIALTTPDTTVNLIIKEGAPLKIIGTQYQKSPLGIVSLKKNNIASPKDLIDKTLAVPPVNVLSVEALLRINKIPKERVKIVPYQYDPTPLLRGEVDATVDFTTNVPFTIQQAGAEAISFLMYDHGFTIYNDTIVVLEETLRDRREDLVKWLRASRRGWEENLKDPTAYPRKFIGSFFKGTGRSLENEIFFNTQQKALIESPNGIFSMTEEGINKNIEALHAIGLSATREMFTTELLEEV